MGGSSAGQPDAFFVGDRHLRLATARTVTRVWASRFPRRHREAGAEWAADTASNAERHGADDRLLLCAVLVRPGHVVEMNGRLNTVTATHAAPLSTGVLHVTLHSIEGTVWRGPAGTRLRVVKSIGEAGR